MVAIILVILGGVHIANGAWMLASPMSWYAAVPGVAQTGPLNHHFVTDVGLAFVASGTGFIVGARQSFAAFAIAGATWPALHALLHVWGWLQHGFPRAGNVALSEAVGVVFIGAIGVLFAWLQARRKGAFP